MALIHRDAPYPHWEFQDSDSGDRLRLVPERGGLIAGWRCQGRELLYLDEARFTDPTLSVRGGMPVLFPILLMPKPKDVDSMNNRPGVAAGWRTVAHGRFLARRAGA